MAKLASWSRCLSPDSLPPTTGAVPRPPPRPLGFAAGNGGFKVLRLEGTARRWRTGGGLRVGASLSSDSAGPIAPLRLESPVGQFLSQILATHPHLLPAAVDQQLEKLQTDRDAEKEKKKSEPSSSGNDLVLYRRIAEVRANERSNAVEEIIYALIVQRFIGSGVTLIPTISQSSNPSGRVDTWPEQENELIQCHSPEAYEMIKNHLALILGNRLGDLSSVAEISKLRVGQVYAASLMYGYFLRRVDERFQLEKSMKILPFGLDEEETHTHQTMLEGMRSYGGGGGVDDESDYVENSDVFGGFSSYGGSGCGVKPTRLKSYVMSFDSDTLQRYASVRSKEALGIIEKHTEALFGKPEMFISHHGTIDSSSDEVLTISFLGLKRVVLEAVTVGSFLWDAESYVDSRYHFV